MLQSVRLYNAWKVSKYRVFSGPYLRTFQSAFLQNIQNKTKQSIN